MDERVWRVAVHQADEDEARYLGWEIANRGEWERAVQELEDAGVAVKVGSDELTAERRVQGLATFLDPAGHNLEIFYGAGIGGRFLSPLGARFVTGDLGIGHAVMLVPAASYAASCDFYINTLGFRVTEHGANLRGVAACLMHCNPRHHSLALLGAGEATGIQHLLFEVDQMDDVGRCWDRCRREKVPISLTIGKHGDDDMFSFYMKSPSGFDVEYGWGGRLLDDSTYSEATLTDKFEETWGHWPPDPEFPKKLEGPAKFGDLDPSKLMEDT